MISFVFKPPLRIVLPVTPKLPLTARELVVILFEFNVVILPELAVNPVTVVVPVTPKLFRLVFSVTLRLVKEASVDICL